VCVVISPLFDMDEARSIYHALEPVI